MPTEHNIEFANIIIFKNDLAEIIINENIELTLDKVHRIHQIFRDNLTAPFFVLVNKINNYSYDFGAIQELGTIKEISGIAIITYSEQAETSSQYLMQINRKKKWNAKTFNSRDAGLEWIKQQKQA